jgi:hypothetical protein
LVCLTLWKLLVTVLLCEPGLVAKTLIKLICSCLLKKTRVFGHFFEIFVWTKPVFVDSLPGFQSSSSKCPLCAL